MSDVIKGFVLISLMVVWIIMLTKFCFLPIFEQCIFPFICKCASNVVWYIRRQFLSASIKAKVKYKCPHFSLCDECRYKGQTICFSAYTPVELHTAPFYKCAHFKERKQVESS